MRVVRLSTTRWQSEREKERDQWLKNGSPLTGESGHIHPNYVALRARERKRDQSLKSGSPLTGESGHIHPNYVALRARERTWDQSLKSGSPLTGESGHIHPNYVAFRARERKWDQSVKSGSPPNRWEWPYSPQLDGSQTNSIKVECRKGGHCWWKMYFTKDNLARPITTPTTIFAITTHPPQKHHSYDIYTYTCLY